MQNTNFVVLRRNKKFIHLSFQTVESAIDYLKDHKDFLKICDEEISTIRLATQEDLEAIYIHDDRLNRAKNTGRPGRPGRPVKDSVPRYLETSDFDLDDIGKDISYGED